MDEKKKPVDIKLYERNAATRLIEEFMIITNEAISEYFTERKIPFLYRIHEKPSSEKSQTFLSFINTISEDPVNISFTPKGLQSLLDEYKDKKEYAQVNYILLRSLSKAKYSNENVGHFGLASDFYSHFTSPIRRYPDLQIHRIIKEYLHGKLSDKRIKDYEKLLPDVGSHSSLTEMKAAQCEMESLKLKMCEFMLDKVGEQFKAKVCGLNDNGLFVSLDNTIEGFIFSSDLDYEHKYFYDEDTFSYHSADDPTDIYTFGTELMVEVSNIDISKKQITFKLIEKFSEK